MRYALLMLALVGCLKPQPPAPPSVTVVEVRRIPIPRTYGTIVDVEIVEEPTHTWITGDELQKLQDERHKKAVHDGLECMDGDPLCSTIP